MAQRGQPVAVSVVEDHDEALVVIYRAIGSKKLPLNGSTLLHFDAHPDLLSPNLPADEFTDKEKLFAFASIAEWILPAVYMGHVGCVVWVKPPWSFQIRDGEHSLVVGRETTSGHLRVATPLAYFISDQLYASVDTLTNVRTIPLYVVTLPALDQQMGHHRSVGQQLSQNQTGRPPEWCEEEAGVSEECEEGPPMSKKKRRLKQHPSPPPPPPPHPLTPPPPVLSSAEAVVCSALGNHRPWILDIDLDFFSTANPFKKEFSQEEYQFLEQLYKFQEPVSDSLEDIAECVESREEQLDALQDLWSEGEGPEEWHWRPFTSDEKQWIAVIKAKIGSLYDGVPLEPEDVHMAGMMTDLPHHPATLAEVKGLMSATLRLVRSVISSPAGLPALVTIARSTEDEFTPADQVEQLLQEAVGVVKNVCDDCITVHHRYLDHTH